MKRHRDPSPPSGDAALQLTLPWFEPSAEPPAPRPTSPAIAKGQRQVKLGSRSVPYELRRSRRRTIGFFVDDSGLRVTAPAWVTLTQIESALLAKQAWIVRKLDEWHSTAPQRAQQAIRWEHGGPLHYRGARLTLHIQSGPTDVQLSGDTLRVCLADPTDAEAIRTVVHAWLQARAHELFAERLPVYAARLGQQPRLWRLSSARTRWGSCAADGSIRLNWRLIHLPLMLVDYVIAHELAHLREMNHGPRFWATVLQLMPDFEAARRQLRQYPSAAC